MMSRNMPCTPSNPISQDSGALTSGSANPLATTSSAMVSDAIATTSSAMVSDAIATTSSAMVSDAIATTSSAMVSDAIATTSSAMVSDAIATTSSAMVSDAIAASGFCAMVSDAATVLAGLSLRYYHAVDFVRRIKMCYLTRPHIYKSFLEILNNYQKKEQNAVKRGKERKGKKTAMEIELYKQIMKLLTDRPDLQAEFLEFIPDDAREISSEIEVLSIQLPQTNTKQQPCARLKNEDALSYLDCLKQRFSSNPQVFNNFLDIMKDFKFQRIGTPGAVTRVSELLKGHPDLIVGFNTFLPPGYKIELNAATNTNVVNQPSMMKPQFVRLKVEDALSYLDQVKQQFCSNLQVYEKFLDIMKRFKSQSIDTPGVITRVSHLFKGHPDLIVGFNTFLPPGYKIELNAATDTISVYQPSMKAQDKETLETETQMETDACQGEAEKHQSGSMQPDASENFSPFGGTISMGISLSSFENSHQQGGKSPRAPLPDAVSEAPASDATTESTVRQPVEFNHAISYVNKIKNCYQSKPDVYESFLKILCDYQKEQKAFKEGKREANRSLVLTESEVYKQVAKLFADRPDLVIEFQKFMPVEAQDKEILETETQMETDACRGEADKLFSHQSGSMQPDASKNYSTLGSDICFYEQAKHTSRFSVDECVICCEEYMDHEIVRFLECMHLFHSLCIDQWYQQKHQCPVCGVQSEPN